MSSNEYANKSSYEMTWISYSNSLELITENTLYLTAIRDARFIQRDG